MKKIILLLAFAATFSSTASTLECDNFGVNYKLTVTKDGKITQLEGIKKYKCIDTNFNLGGFTVPGSEDSSDGITCLSKGAKKKEFITLYEDDSIRLIPLSDVGYFKGHLCK